jgi:hypothetical protein
MLAAMHFSLFSSRLLFRNVKFKVHKIVILPLISYACEIWFLIFREGNKLRVFENRLLRRIFGPNRNEVTGEWRKLHSGELHKLYSSPDIRQIK